jgi:hypothetical protein
MAAGGWESTFTRNLPCLRGIHGSSDRWLALIDEAPSVTLLNPLTSATVKLPPAYDLFVGEVVKSEPMDLPSSYWDLPSCC